MQKLLLLLLVFVGFHAAADTTIYLVRHAEKDLSVDNKDPELTQIGLFRAKNIANLLSSVGVTQIFSTQYQRCLQTAQPLADYQGINITPYDAKNPQQFAQQLKQIQGTVLVVGHSNTLPELVQLLSNQAVNTIAEDEYDNVYQVIITATQTILNRLKSIPSYAINQPAIKLTVKKTYSAQEMAPILEKLHENQ